MNTDNKGNQSVPIDFDVEKQIAVENKANDILKRLETKRNPSVKDTEAWLADLVGKWGSVNQKVIVEAEASRRHKDSDSYFLTRRLYTIATQRNNYTINVGIYEDGGGYIECRATSRIAKASENSLQERVIYCSPKNFGYKQWCEMERAILGYELVPLPKKGITWMEDFVSENDSFFASVKNAHYHKTKEYIRFFHNGEFIVFTTKTDYISDVIGLTNEPNLIFLNKEDSWSVGSEQSIKDFISANATCCLFVAIQNTACAYFKHGIDNIFYKPSFNSYEINYVKENYKKCMIKPMELSPMLLPEMMEVIPIPCTPAQ